MENRTRTVFLTGGSGFLGRHFMRDAANEGLKFYLLSRDKSRLVIDYPDAVEGIIEADISETEKYSSVLNECGYFINMAGEKRDENDMVKVNAKSLEKVLLLVSTITHLKFMQISSCGVYGIRKHPDILILEDSVCFPDTSYEKSKLSGDRLIEEFARTGRLSYLILRPSNVFGEFDSSLKLLNLMKAISTNRFFLLDKEALVNYVYAGYVTRAMIHFIKTGIFDNQVYNINSPSSISWFVDRIKSELGIGGKTKKLPALPVQLMALFSEILPESMRLIDRSKYLALTNRKAYSNDKLEYLVPGSMDMLSKGIADLVRHYKMNNHL